MTREEERKKGEMTSFRRSCGTTGKAESETGEERSGKHSVVEYNMDIRKEKDFREYIERQNDAELIRTWIEEN
jgi:hypothetical protein